MSPGVDGPTIEVGAIVVVFDGNARLRWEMRANGERCLQELWPSDVDRAELLQHLESGGALLVVLERDPVVLAVYPHEIVTGLDRFETVTSMSGLVELELPVLEWMPEPLRSRGMIFVDQTDEIMRSTPEALLPTLIVESTTDECQVRFARRVGRSVSARACREAAEHIFATLPVPIIEGRAKAGR